MIMTENSSFDTMLYSDLEAFVKIPFVAFIVEKYIWIYTE